MTKRKKHILKLSFPTLATILAFTFGIGLTISYVLPESFQQKQMLVPDESVKVCFTPNQRCQSLILQAITQAQRTIHVQAYSFTSQPIANALIKAHEKGVHVQVLADKSQETAKHSKIQRLAQTGIPVLIDRNVAIAHNKVILIDDYTLLTGSYNFSKAAEYRNAENLLIIKNPKLAQEYLQNWESRAKVSIPSKYTPQHRPAQR